MKQESSNKFDKIFEERFSDFKAEPSSSVWDNIEKDLDKKTSPKWGVWISSAVVVAIVSTYVIVSNVNTKSTTKKNHVAVVSESNTTKLNVKKSNTSTPSEDNINVESVSEDEITIQPKKKANHKTQSSNPKSSAIKQEEEPIEKIEPKNTNFYYPGEVITISTPVINRSKDMADTIIINEKLADFLDSKTIKMDLSNPKVTYDINTETNTIVWTISSVPSISNTSTVSPLELKFDIKVTKEVEKSEFQAYTTYTYKYPNYERKEEHVIPDIEK